MPGPLDPVLRYHQLSKHSFQRYAPGPGGLDWATQPDPFRRYGGAPLVPLILTPASEGEPGFDQALGLPGLAPLPVHAATASRLLQDSVGLSAWKGAQGASWALRMNPSSGNLHPTETYLVGGPVPGLLDRPVVAHYAPREHGLEVRASILPLEWEGGPGTASPDLVVGLSSLHWREAWKYGERAFRYCQLDVGHALASLAVAAAGLGWRARLLDGPTSTWLEQLLGLAGQRQRPDAETAECLVAVWARPQAGDAPVALRPGDMAAVEWCGEPSAASPEYVRWEWVERMAASTRKEVEGAAHQDRLGGARLQAGGPALPPRPVDPPLRRIVHQRRSAVEMDPRGRLDADAFYRILAHTLPESGRVPLGVLGWAPLVHLLLFVHRVDDVAPGLYLLLRNPGDEGALREGALSSGSWEAAPGCPAGLPLRLLRGGDVRRAAAALSCQQAIAADGCFSLGMIARFREPLEKRGPWMYSRLYWECGLLGQVLYLEAEAAGLRGTGIGCFFDDPVHEILGLADDAFQSLYHFTVGRALEDGRLTTLPAYPPGRPDQGPRGPG
ncbi:MAG: SagB/ThcOx family dehydrogenase [Gemmatimonadota bacterium]